MKQKLQIFLDRHKNRPQSTGLVSYWQHIDRIKKNMKAWIQSHEFNVAELSTEEVRELARLQDYYKPVTDKYFISALFYEPISNTEES